MPLPVGNSGPLPHPIPVNQVNSGNPENGVNNVNPENPVNDVNNVNQGDNVHLENVGDHENNVDPAAVPPDPAVENVMENGVGPDLQPGNGQGQNFVANHEIAIGRDWDLNSPKGMVETAQKAIANIKKVISGEEQFAAFKDMLDNAVRNAINVNAQLPKAEHDFLLQQLTECKALMNELQAVRLELTAAVKDGSGLANPREALAQIRKTLRVFRYDMQCELAKRGHESGKMDFNEGNLRAIENAFTFFVGSKVKQTFARVMELEARFDESIALLRNALHAADGSAMPPSIPPDVKLSGVVGEALELSHRTNDRIRDFQDMDATTSTLRGLVGPMAEKGGFRKVEFTVGIGALIGLGFSEAFTAGLRVGARIRVIGEINAPGKGRPISVTYRVSVGAEAKAGIKAGDESFSPEAKAEASAGVEVSHFTTRTYQTLDDLILDAKRCKLATSRTIGAAVVGGLKSLGFSIYKLGRKVFRWLGTKAGEIKQDNAAYLQSLKARGVAGSLDRLLAKRTNPVIVAEREGWTVHGRTEASVSANVVEDVLTMGISGKLSREKDFRVVARTYSPIARIVRNAPDIDALNALMRPGPDGVHPGPVTHYDGSTPTQVFRSLEINFDEAIREGEEVERRFGTSDIPRMASVANKIRSLMLATELAFREGKLSREAADALLNRYSILPFKLPPDILREYLMVDIGAAKPAKIRTSTSAKLNISLFKGWSDGLTGEVSNSIVKAVADGAVTEMRHQIGLDTTFEYRFSSEKPANPGQDPRPWENAVKTSHELAITASTPMRVIMDAITRTVVNKGERIENKSESIAKDTAKGVLKDLASDIPLGVANSAAIGFILSSVKESLVAAAKSWLSKPENVGKLLCFIIDNAGAAFSAIVGALEWVCEHPEATQLILGSIEGSSLISESERAKVLKWSFVNGELDTIGVSFETFTKLGVNVDPVGVAIGGGFDISYTVTHSEKERECCPRPTLLMLLERGETFMLGETGLKPFGSGEAFKNWLARNALGVQHMVDNLLSDANKLKNLEIYQRALMAAEDDVILQQRLQEDWLRVTTLPPDATLDQKVDAVHKLVNSMVTAFHQAI